MNTNRPEGEGRSPRRVSTITVLAVVATLLLLPASVVSLSALSATPSPAGGTQSGLTPAWDKTVDFVETGLASGTTWSVSLKGTLSSSDTNTISFSEIPGTYKFNVTPVSGYTASPSSGTVKVPSDSNGVTVKITFTPVSISKYTVFFNETGLAPGTTWWVDFDGTNTSATVPSINFSVPDGTYTFTDPGVVSGASGVQFVTDVLNGTVTVNGANLSVAIPYSTQYFLTMIAYPPAGGTVTPTSSWYAAGASVVLSAVPATGYAFLNWSGSGPGNYTGTSATPTITMNGPISENATFGFEYAVTFQESGLPDGVSWSVTFHGTTQSGYLVFLDFSAPNGTYSYSVAPIAGYHADSYAGAVTVKGNDVTVQITWVRVTYNVTFEETGLPSGTTWTATLNGTTENNVTPLAIVFSVANGTLPWTIAPISGYTANVTSGSVHVNGAAIVVKILWTPIEKGPPPTYSVTFTELGLPSGTSWAVTLNGSSKTVTAPTTISFVVPNGTLPWTVAPISGYTPDVAGASVTVKGGNVGVTITWTAVGLPVTMAYTITFVEKGLPSGISWSVDLNSTTSVSTHSTTSSNAFTGVTAGTYQYWVPDVGSYAPMNSTGKVVVSDANLTIDVTFTGLGPAKVTPPSTTYSIWDLVIVAFIVLAALLVSYVIFRRR
jgi:hypothetical protein